MTGKIFSPLLLLLAELTESELLHTIQFLKAKKRFELGPKRLHSSLGR